MKKKKVGMATNRTIMKVMKKMLKKLTRTNLEGRSLGGGDDGDESDWEGYENIPSLSDGFNRVSHFQLSFTCLVQLLENDEQGQVCSGTIRKGGSEQGCMMRRPAWRVFHSCPIAYDFVSLQLCQRVFVPGILRGD